MSCALFKTLNQKPLRIVSYNNLDHETYSTITPLKTNSLLSYICIRLLRLISFFLKLLIPSISSLNWQNEDGPSNKQFFGWVLIAHNADKTGESTQTVVDFNFSDGGYIRVVCNDWSKKFTAENGWIDELNVVISSKELVSYINSDANN